MKVTFTAAAQADLDDLLTSTKKHYHMARDSWLSGLGR
jgi:hypothetical protein